MIEPLEERVLLSADFANLGLAVSGGSIQVDGDFSAFNVSESSQGSDLNGDGDTSDDVLHLFDARTRSTTNLRFAAVDFVLQGPLLAFRVSESGQSADLNNDGDLSDNVLHLYDAGTGTTTNLQFAASFGLQLEGHRLAFRVSEFRQGTDLNGDSDLSDEVLHIFDTATGVITNIGLTASSFQLNGDRLAFSVSEGLQADMDLNSDGDTSDSVLHIFDANTGTTTNLGLYSTHFQLDGDRLAFRVPEEFQGNADLNGDGDAFDSVLHILDSSSGAGPTNIGLAAFSFQLDGDLLAFLVNERDQGQTDLNGDGDIGRFGFGDDVLHIFDAKTGSTTNLGLEARFDFQLEGERVAFLVSERNQGNRDLNGDGDTLDDVLHLFDAGTTINLGQASFGYQLDGDYLAFIVLEGHQGGGDLNGDVDASDSVLHVFDAAAGSLVNLRLSVPTGFTFQLSGDWLAFLVSETAQGDTDLNGDRDTTDSVMHLFDIATGTTINFGLAVGSFFLKDDTLVFLVEESRQGLTDFNGDRDLADLVVHVADLQRTRVFNFDDVTHQIMELDLDGRIEAGLLAKVEAASDSLANDRETAAAAQITAILKELAALVHAHKLDEASAQTLSERLEEALALL